MSQRGANLTGSHTRFEVWAPAAKSVEVVFYNESHSAVPMERGSDGVFVVEAPVGAGCLYKYRLDRQHECPDPYSLFQPDGPHGPSMVIDRNSYRWRDSSWHGLKLKDHVIYELHVGAFTQQGTFDAAAEKLTWLRSIGITTIEVMPVAAFPGKFNWGYDGVNLFSPYCGYGDFEALKRFVDEAHGLGMAVILDVVYNHVGPDGNYLGFFSSDYFSGSHSNDWGTPFNVDGPNAPQVRRFIVDNACYWIREFHLDGLRLDAACNIPDNSPRHVLSELIEAARAAANPKTLIIIAEDEQQHGDWLLPQEQGGLGLDAVWNDDFHHSAHVAVTGDRGAYFHDYLGSAQEFVSACKYGFLFQGQYYYWQRQPRGERAPFNPRGFISFLDNHDQVANILHGRRIHQQTSPGRYRALTSLLLLSPQTPMLFMGQEFAASTPFHFFADHAHNPSLRHAVHQGRRQFLSQFLGAATEEGLKKIIDPADDLAISASKLNWSDSEKNIWAVHLHKNLIELRRTDPVLSDEGIAIDGAVLSDNAFLLRWFDSVNGDRLLIVNLGAQRVLHPCPEPLLAPAQHYYWSQLFSSDDVIYGGNGVQHPQAEEGWVLPGETATFLYERPCVAALE